MLDFGILTAGADFVVFIAFVAFVAFVVFVVFAVFVDAFVVSNGIIP